MKLSTTPKQPKTLHQDNGCKCLVNLIILNSDLYRVNGPYKKHNICKYEDKHYTTVLPGFMYKTIYRKIHTLYETFHHA